MSESLPGSAMTVLLSLRTEGPMCPQDISRKTRMPLRTVNYALKQLLNLFLIKKIPNLQDLRKTLYCPDYEGATRTISHYGSDSLVAVQVHMLMHH